MLKIGRKMTKGRVIFGVLSILTMSLLIVTACGDASEPTPDIDATVEARTAATIEAMPEPTATPEPENVIRPRSEWTPDNPAARMEIEAELENYRGMTITYGTWGGAYTAGEEKAWFQPIRDQFGIDVLADGTANPNTKLRAIAETQNFEWTFALGTTPVFAELGELGLLEPLDKSVVDNRNFAGILKDHTYFGGAGGIASEPLAYSTNTYTEETRPKTMKDFFDVENFPGVRALDSRGWTWLRYVTAAYWSENPEHFGTTDGVLSVDQIDEAYEYLDAIKPHIDVWAASSSDCPTFLIVGEVDMCLTGNGRFGEAILRGDPLQMSWEAGHLMTTFAQVIPGGLKDAEPEQFELTQLIMAYLSLPEINNQISRYVQYSPINQDSWPLLDLSVFDHSRQFLPTSPVNAQYGWLVDEVWQTGVTSEQTERYVAWQSEL
jgi:putative spermidine/putrescine transport system substrate-binding protein